MRKLFTPVLGALLSLAPALLASAQDNSLTPSSLDSVQMTQTIDEVVVSGLRIMKPTELGKISAPARQLPMTTSIITSKGIQALGVNEITEVTNLLPGVTAHKQYGAFHMVMLRGIMNTLMLNDGMRDDRAAFWQSAPITGLASVDRIEVIKGAASLQGGHSALGGLVNIVHKKPTFTPTTNVRFSYGSYGTGRAAFGYSTGLSDNFAVRADLEGVYSDGWRQNYERGVNGAIAFRWLPAAGQILDFAVRANRDNYRGDYGLPILPQDVTNVNDPTDVIKGGWMNPNLQLDRAYSADADDLAHKSVLADLQYQWNFGEGWKLSEHLMGSWDDIFYYSTDEVFYAKSEQHLPGYDYTYMGTKEVNGQRVPVRMYLDPNKVGQGQFSFAYTTKAIQNQLELTKTLNWGNTKHNFLIGYNFALMNMDRRHGATCSGKGTLPEHKVVDVVNPQTNQGAINIDFFRVRQLYRDISHSLYLQDFMTWGKLNLMAGVRMEYVDRKFSQYQTADSDVMKAKEPNFTNPTKTPYATYRVGAVYNFTEDFNVFAASSSFFKPQLVKQSGFDYVDKNDQPMKLSDVAKVKPTTGIQYEMGFRFGDQEYFSVEANVYYMKTKNVLAFKKGDDKLLGYFTDNQSIKGFEVDALITPCKYIQLSANYTYSDSKENGDKQVGLVPRHKAFEWLMLQNTFDNNHHVMLGFGHEFMGTRFTDGGNEYTIPSYNVFNLMARYNYERYGIQLNLNNIADKLYYESAVSSFQFIPAKGRNVTVTLTYDI